MKSSSNAFTMITPSFASAPPTFQINFSFSLICACLFERSLHPSWLRGKKNEEKVQTAKLQRQTATDTGGHCLPTHAGY